MRERVLGSLGVGLLLLTAGVLAQAPRPLPGSAMPGPPARPPAPAGPVRDNVPTTAATGTARISGRVVSAENGAPLRRAQVQINTPQTRLGLSATTDADGRYEFLNLPAGSYMLAVSRAGYVDLRYGQERPFEGGKPLMISDGQRAEKIDFALQRGGIITGKITDEYGEAATGIRVQVMRYVYTPNGRQLTFGMTGFFGPSATDDLGQFRVFGLAPGEYVVAATAVMGPMMSPMPGPPVGSTAVAGQNDGFIMSYYPGTANAAEAQEITVQAGRETSVYFSMASGRLSRITGIVRTSQGRPLVGAMLSIMTRTGTMTNTSGGGVTGPDGAFNIANVAPGEHVIFVRPRSFGGPPRPGAPSDPEDQEFASVGVDVNGADITGLVITTGSGATVSGRLVFDGTASTAKRPTPYRVMVSQAEPGAGMPGLAANYPDNGVIDDAGRFQIRGVHGKVLFRPMTPSGWALRAVTFEGTDITDVPFDVTRNVTGVDIILTDRLTNVSGVVRRFGGEVAKDASVIVIPAIIREDAVPARFIRASRPNDQGRYTFAMMPPGDYYIAAVESLEQGRQFDPAFQQQIKLKGHSFRLTEGQTVTLDLQLMQ